MGKLYTSHTPPSEPVKQSSFSTTASASSNPSLFILGSRNGGALPPQGRKQQLTIHSVCSNFAIDFLIVIVIIIQGLTRRPMNNKTILPGEERPTRALVLAGAANPNMGLPISAHSVPFRALVALPLLLAVFPAIVLLDPS